MITDNCLNTPCFLIDKQLLDKGIQSLKNALDNSWSNYIIGYSYKTNALKWIIQYFKEQGCYSEVVSDDEYELAKSIGVDNQHIIYNGIAKSKNTFLEAVKSHSIVNIDSEYEIDWLDEIENGDYNVGIRVNFDLESFCPGQTQCGEEGERFGFCYENGELGRAIRKIESKGIHVAGLHLHKSSKTRMPDIYRAIANVAVEIRNKYNMDLSYIDIGGGFFGGLESKPQFHQYFGEISGILSQCFDPIKTTLIVEPGMAVIGASVDYITTVVDVKKTTRNIFVVTDGSRTQIDPLMTKSGYFYDVEQLGDRTILDRQIVCGFTCMEHDRLFTLCEGKEFIRGDRITYHKVGAYTMCLSPLFIKWFPAVYVKDIDELYLVRERWNTADYLSGSVIQ